VGDSYVFFFEQGQTTGLVKCKRSPNHSWTLIKKITVGHDQMDFDRTMQMDVRSFLGS
jgi:hypothetical protein